MWPLIAMYILLIPCAALFIHTKHKGRTRLSVLFKALATGVILCAGIYGALNSPGETRTFAAFIAAGLAMGLAGDVAICCVFALGMLFFGMGHLCYIAALLRVSANALWAVPIFLLLCPLIFSLYKKSGISFGKLMLPAIIYCAIITAMLSLAATAAFSVFPAGAVLFVGALLFTASDAMLALNAFDKSFNNGLTKVDRFNIRPEADGFKQKLDTVSLCCYYLGQSLFAVSIYCL